MGWHGFLKNPFSFLITQKFVHLVVGLVVVIFVISNLTLKTKAVSLNETVGQTILADLVESEFGSLEENQLVEEFFNEGIESSFGHQSYLDNSATVQTQPTVLMGAPEDIIAGEDVGAIAQGGTALVKPEIVSTSKTRRMRKETIFYTVESGDSVSTIAEEYGVSVNTILWENDLNAYSLIRPGTKLAVLPVSGVSHSVKSGDNLASLAKKYGVEVEKIIEINNLGENESLAVGQKLIIPGGAKTGYVKSSAVVYSGLSAIKDLVKTPDATPVAGNKMNWPTEGHRITQYYSWKHHGLDIANKVGTPLYAADAGTVEYAGWGTGYGNTILIDHGGGKKTRYAHLSKFYIEKGDKVDKGETIGAMGSTGWSTGSHLHFEVIIDGAKYNPLNYIK